MDFTKIFDFAGDIPAGAKYAAALVFVLILILLVSWVLKKISAKVRIGGRRGARLKVQESIMVDTTRTLTLVKCDNVEHLILLGGTSDLVVASNIQETRAAAKPPARSPALAAAAATPALQPLASAPVRPVPPAPPAQKQPPEPAAEPQLAAPQQATVQPLPTPPPRSRPALPQSASANPARTDAQSTSQSAQSEPGQINGEDSAGAEPANSPSLSNIRPGDEK